MRSRHAERNISRITTKPPARKAATPPPKPRAAPRNWLADVTVTHGPVDMIGRFFLLADTMLKARGIALSFATYEELLEVNQRNQDTWGILTTMYDHRCCPHGLSPERAFCFLGRDARGEVVATHGARVYDLGDRSMHEVAEARLLHHDEPERTAGPHERIEVSSPAAKSIRGKLMINGGVWYHPQYRKRQLTMLIPRIARVLSYTRWQIDWSMGLTMEGPTGGGVIDSLGYQKREWGLQILNAQNGSPRCCLAWMDAEELLADLRGFLAGSATQAYVGVDDRRAEKQG